MPTIGLLGGHTVWTLGPPTDAQAFFRAVADAELRWPADLQPSLITDRLYRRYLRAEELPAACRAMDLVQAHFGALTSAADEPPARDALQRALHQARRAALLPGSLLPQQAATLSALFAGLFERFREAVQAALCFQADFDRYQAVRLVVADMPAFMVDKQRPLADYDALQGPPLWLR